MNPAKVVVLYDDIHRTGPAAVKVRAETISPADARLAGPKVLLSTQCHAETVSEILTELAVLVSDSVYREPPGEDTS